MMDKSKLLSKKRHGDLNIVSEILTTQLGKYISPQNAGKLLERESARNHKAAIEALEKVISTREQLTEVTE